MKVGKDSVVIGNIPSDSHVGDGSVVIGATDSRGNTNINQPMAVGRRAQATPGSIAIGAFARAGNAGPHGKGGDFTMIGGSIKGGDAIMSAPVENEKPTPPVRSFLHHPLTIWVLGIISSIIVAFVTWYFGFK